MALPVRIGDLMVDDTTVSIGALNFVAEGGDKVGGCSECANGENL